MPNWETFEGLLKRASASDDVTALQNDLKRLGYDPGRVCGEFGPMTFSAVRRFQKDHGLVDDGEFGLKTAAAFAQALAEAKSEKRPLGGLKLAAAAPPSSAPDDQPKKPEIKTIKRVMSFGVSTGVSSPKKKKP